MFTVLLLNLSNAVFHRVLSYHPLHPITVFADHAPVTELLKGRNLTGRLARWYLTIQEFGPTFKYLPGRANVIADSLCRNIPVGSVAEMPSQIENSTQQDLAAAQRQHDVWSGHIHFGVGWWNKSPVTTCVFFHIFSCLRIGSFVATGPAKRTVASFVVPECYATAVLNLVHDTVVACHPERERTLAAARSI